MVTLVDSLVDCNGYRKMVTQAGEMKRSVLDEQGVKDRDMCERLCSSTPTCNAVAFSKGRMDSSGRYMCYPKTILPYTNIPPNTNPAVDFMTLCPPQLACGEWMTGLDYTGIGDIPGAARVRACAPLKRC
jgi:hypothetical protein